MYFMNAFVLRQFGKLRFILKRVENITAVFHRLIIASFLLSVSGCGYKAPPYYEQSVPKEDKNVKFIIQKKEFNNDTNESCAP